MDQPRVVTTEAQEVTRRCAGASGCGGEKPITEFGRTKSGRVKTVCRRCEAARQRRVRAEDPDRVLRMNLKRLYGITPEDYEAMRAAQDYRCAICNRHETECPPPAPGRPRNDGTAPAAVRILSVDHCHESGRVRSLLCTECNLALGKIREDLYRISGLYRYVLWSTPFRDGTGRDAVPAALDGALLECLSALMRDESVALVVPSDRPEGHTVVVQSSSTEKVVIAPVDIPEEPATLF